MGKAAFGPPHGLFAVMLVAAPAMMATSAFAAPDRVIENAELRYRVAIPDACRVEEGPGTLEAVCDVLLDAEKSKSVPAAAALLMEIDAEPVLASAPAYGEAEFRRDVPESVCGEADTAKVKIGSFEQKTADGSTAFSAEVICPPIRFLALPERKAYVHTVISAGIRHRLMARAPSADLETVKPIAQAFITSFRLLPEKKP